MSLNNNNPKPKASYAFRNQISHRYNMGRLIPPLNLGKKPVPGADLFPSPQIHRSLSPRRKVPRPSLGKGSHYYKSNVGKEGTKGDNEWKTPLGTQLEAIRIDSVAKRRARPWESGFRELIQTQLNSYRLSRVKEGNNGTTADVVEEVTDSEDSDCEFRVIKEEGAEYCQLPAIKKSKRGSNKGFLYDTHINREGNVLTHAARSGGDKDKEKDKQLTAGVVGSRVCEKWKSVKPNSKFSLHIGEDLGNTIIKVPDMPRGTASRYHEIAKKSATITYGKDGRKLAGLLLNTSANSSNLQSKSDIRSTSLDPADATPSLDLTLVNIIPAPILTTNKGNKKHLACSIVPINLESEEKAFFDSDCKKNPQFEYENQKLVQRTLALYQKPSRTLLPLAVKIIDAFLKRYTTETRHLERDGGEILSLEETRCCFQRYIDELKLSELIQLRFSRGTVSPTTIAHDPNTGISTITIGLPIEYRRNKIRGVLNHEIGTHFIRKYNDRLQVWYHCRRSFQLKNYIATEEGLASINQLFELATDSSACPYLYKPAIYYYTCCMADQMSFVELYADLSKYVDNPRRRFKMCLRAKRGIEDTATSGGFFKDKVYFEGAIKILLRRRTIDWKLLFSGKLSADDLERPEIRGKICTEEMIFPYFVRDERVYAAALDRIAEENFLS